MSSSERYPSALAEDTIVAVITPPGEGGVAALRLAGPNSRSIFLNHFTDNNNNPVSSSDLKPFMLRFGYFVTGSEVLDEITAVYMPPGKSYTGEAQIELFCHGGRQIVRQIQQILIESGARSAEPGEFTKLAFLNGKIDLAKAESVAEIIAANTENSLKASREHLLGAYVEHISMLRDNMIALVAEIEASIDYPEDEIEPSEQQELLEIADSVLSMISDLIKTYQGGRLLTEGFKIAIGGRPNAGKSSLFNLMLQKERALVTPTAGTTRDYLSEWLDIGGNKVELIDTAGIRKSSGAIEKAGIESARKIIKSSDLLLWVCDSSKKEYLKDLKSDIGEFGNTSIIIIYNKIDKATSSAKGDGPNEPAIRLSCKTKKGYAHLERALITEIEENLPDLTSGVVVTSQRHRQKLTAAKRNIAAARKKIITRESPELTAFDIRSAINDIDEITGKVYNDDILDKIFAKFCIGK